MSDKWLEELYHAETLNYRWAYCSVEFGWQSLDGTPIIFKQQSPRCRTDGIKPGLSNCSKPQQFDNDCWAPGMNPESRKLVFTAHVKAGNKCALIFPQDIFSVPTLSRWATEWVVMFTAPCSQTNTAGRSKVIVGSSKKMTDEWLPLCNNRYDRNFYVANK